MRGIGSDERGATSPIGTLLLVALAIVAAAGVGVFVLELSSDQGAPTAEAAFEYQETPAGLEMTAVGMGEDVIVQLNGQAVASFDSDEAGKTVLLPTAPGDRITVVSREGDQTVLVNRRVDERSEVGDLIAYYSFDQGTGSTIVDRSGNGNDGEAFGGWSRVSDDTGTAIDFDGTWGSHVDIGDLTVDGPASVDEITIAIEYEKEGGPTASRTSSNTRRAALRGTWRPTATTSTPIGWSTRSGTVAHPAARSTLIPSTQANLRC